LDAQRMLADRIPPPRVPPECAPRPVGRPAHDQHLAIRRERGAELVLRRPRYARRCPALEVESENVGLPAHVGVVEKAAAVTQEPGLVVIAGPSGRIPRCAQLARLPLDAETGNETDR